MSPNTPSPSGLPSRKSRRVQSHYQKTLGMLESLNGSAYTDDSTALGTIHELLNELGDFSRSDADLSSDYLNELADLLLEATFGMIDKARLQRFLESRWMDQIIANDIRFKYSSNPLPFFKPGSVVPDRRAGSRRSHGGCRRSYQRTTIPTDRRFLERRGLPG